MNVFDNWVSRCCVAVVLLVGGHLVGRSLPVKADRSGPSLADVDTSLVPLPRYQSATSVLDRILASRSVEFSDLLDDAVEEEDPRLRTLLLRSLFDRWLRADPDAAMRAAASHSFGADSLRLPLMAIGRWVRFDAEAALSSALDSPEPNELISAVVHHVASNDPEHFFALVEAFSDRWPEGEPNEGHFQTAWAALAELDPDRALEMLRHDPPAVGAKGAALALAERLALELGQAAFQTLEEIANKEFRDIALDSALKTLAKKNPRAAAVAYERLIAKGEEADVRMSPLAKIVGALTKEDPVYAYEWLQSIPAGKKRFGGKWNSAIRAMLTELPPNAKDMHAFFSVCEEWERHLRTIGSWTTLEEADRIAAEALELPSDKVRDALLHQAVRRWAWTLDVDAAVQFASNVSEADLRRDLYRSILDSHGVWRLGERVFEVAEAGELEHIPPNALEVIAKTKPEAALSHISTYQDTKGDARKSIRTVAGIMGQVYPDRFVEWIDGVAHQSVRQLATEAAVDSWARYDTYSASEWAATLPEGMVRDTAVAQIIDELVNTEPDSAMQWGVSMADPKLRANSLNQLAHVWARSDQSSAFDAFLSHPDLVDTERLKYLKTIESTAQQQR